MDTDTFNAVFWSFFITTMVGCILKSCSLLYKSKCKEVECCCIKIVRDVETEEKETEFLATHSNNESMKNQNVLS